jgi:hypothetical protein
MMKMSDEHHIDEPALPRELLPGARPAPDSAAWVDERARIMAHLEPALRTHTLHDRDGWSMALGAWWKPAAALAAAAALLLVFTDMPAPRSEAALPLSVVAAQGAPESLWDDADPVLALIVAQSAANGR